MIASKVVYVACFTCSNWNDDGKIEIDCSGSVAPEAVAGHATTHQRPVTTFLKNWSSGKCYLKSLIAIEILKQPWATSQS